jgi:RHS repeat-associated protein
MRTAPAPNIPPLPGMCPGEFLAAGGGGGGGGSDSADAAGDDKESDGTEKDGKDAESDQKAAPDYEKYPTCGTESHPVDVVTGRVFTHPIVDLSLPGPLPFAFERSYSSTASREDQGLGLGWAHSLGWFVQVGRRRVTVWNERGVNVDFPVPEIGHSVVGDWGWVLRRDNWGYAVDAGDHLWRVFSVTYDEGKTFKLSAIDDRNRNRIAITYEDGKLLEVIDSAGRTIRFTATREGRIEAILVKNAEHQGRWVPFARYEYDEHGRLVRVTDADDYAWTYEYDEFDRLTCDTDRAGLSFCFKYDEKDRGIEAWGEYRDRTDPSLAEDLPKFLHDGRTRAKGIYHRKFDYHDTGCTEVTDTTETRRYFGNKKGTLDKAVTGGAVTSSKYDARGFEIEKTDAMQGTWRWVRDARGRELAVVDPLLRRAQYERDEHGLVVMVVDPAGYVTRLRRDQRGNLVEVHDPSGGTAQLEYNEQGLVVAVTLPNGATTRFAYDAAGNLLRLVWANGATWFATYDGLGRRLSVTDPLGATTHYEYSATGQVVGVVDALGGRTRYDRDGEGHVTRTVTPKGVTHHYLWGGFHKLCARRDAGEAVIRYAYSREGELLRVTNELGEVHSYFYTRAGQLAGETTFDGRELRYRNDLNGRVVRVENGAGEFTELVYDLAGQLTERRLPDDTERFEYDPRGDLIFVSNGAGMFRFQRDAMGRIERESHLVAGREHWVTAAYDAMGSRTRMQTSLGLSLRIERDGTASRTRTWLDELRVDHANDPFGREVARRLDGGATLETHFDPIGRVVQRSVRAAPGPSLVAAGEPVWVGPWTPDAWATSYAYDADGELASRHDPTRGLVRYEYDGNAQLLAAVPDTGAALLYRYDPAGNIHEGQEPTVYGKGNRLLRKGDTEYDWDGDGRLVARRSTAQPGAPGWVYLWSATGLLVQADSPNGARLLFTYDPLSRRHEKQVLVRDGAGWKLERTVRYVWDRDIVAHEIVTAGDGTPDSVTDYVFGDDGPEPLFTRRDGGNWMAFSLTPIGAADALIGTDGQIVQVSGDSPWGRTSGAPTAVGHVGQYYDEDLGFYYNRFRYYDPRSARFVSRDPIGLDGGMNAFAFVPNPFGFSDFFGLMPWAWNGDDGMGHHLVPRKKADSAGMPELATERDTPTFFPIPYHDGDHEKLHRAQKPFIGKAQGDWDGTPEELRAACKKGLKDPSVKGMKGDLRIPNTGEVIAKNVTPAQAYDALMKWQKKNK